MPYPKTGYDGTRYRGLYYLQQKITRKGMTGIYIYVYIYMMGSRTTPPAYYRPPNSHLINWTKNNPSYTEIARTDQDNWGWVVQGHGTETHDDRGLSSSLSWDYLENACLQPPGIPAVPNCRVSLKCPTTKYPCSPIAEYPCSAQAMNTKYPCSAQPQNIPAVPNRRVCLQCPTAEYPYTAQLQSIPAVPKHQVSLQCPTAEYICSAQPQSVNILAAHLQCCKEDS